MLTPPRAEDVTDHGRYPANGPESQGENGEHKVQSMIHDLALKRLIMFTPPTVCSDPLLFRLHKKNLLPEKEQAESRFFTILQRNRNSLGFSVQYIASKSRNLSVWSRNLTKPCTGPLQDAFSLFYGETLGIFQATHLSEQMHSGRTGFGHTHTRLAPARLHRPKVCQKRISSPSRRNPRCHCPAASTGAQLSVAHYFFAWTPRRYPPLQIFRENG